MAQPVVFSHQRASLSSAASSSKGPGVGPTRLRGVFAAWGGEQATVSALAGSIWRWSGSQAFDAALRVGRASGQALLEARPGLTFSLDLLGRTW